MRGSLILTDAKSVILYSSSDTTLRTGFDIPEIIGKRPGDLWGGLMPATFYQKMWRKIRSGEGYVSRVLNKHKGGEQVKDTLNIVPVLDEHGEARYFLELHPELNSMMHRRRFQKDFHAVVKPDADPDELAEFLTRWFAFDQPFQADSREHFLEDLHAQLVKPSQELFLHRDEDRELVIAAKARPETFKQLYIKYLPNIRRFFHFRLADAELAEDMAQDVFLRAFRALDSYTPSNASYLTYLLRIAHNQLVSHYRGAQNQQLLTDQESSDGWLESFLRRDAIERALVHVTDIERSIVLKKYREGLSVRDIATELSRSENAVKLHLSRARKKLKDVITNKTELL
ncbi:hypothetical protein COX00_03575 [Candidatus Uhrbacteria bacterium CG22_combo_CG10-13_8_21_14_all_47_17]|uniref:HTH luxR-type domain-containing protein n=1 Tax=Candidatus Uhrbacteria bacterium CG22_combo_CG10-13_8_21_14_all_47_17 TaxID=1975041 RepID=A0A2H0BRS7_9BACT|nr:MAG: hypothetical protein COX00_03575 [Candidatus Uhrbacteria bacterium CG22_combo_CG10-13_8_21_14_all_47_17]